LFHVQLLDLGVRFRANMAHIRQARPNSGLGFEVKVLETVQVVPSSPRSGRGDTLSRCRGAALA